MTLKILFQKCVICTTLQELSALIFEGLLVNQSYTIHISL